MSIDEQIERAIIEGAARALFAAADRAAERGRRCEDGAGRQKHERDASTWETCAADVAAMVQTRGEPDDPGSDPDEPAPAPVEPSPKPVAPAGALVAA